MIPVIWFDHPAPGKNISRGYWDQGTLEAYFAGTLWRHGLHFEHRHDFGVDGAVVVIPARFHAEHVDLINAELARLRWCVVILSSDEESLFPADRIEHPNCVVWVSTPHPGKYRGDRVLGHYLPPHAPALIGDAEHENRPLDWFFSGQTTHIRRDQMWRALKRCHNGEGHRTPGFTQGMDPADYYGRMAAAKIIPCPSGPATPDSFRLWEALEAGCVPVADAVAPAMPDPGYWRQFGDVPFPQVQHWDELRATMQDLVNDWPWRSVECFAWWQQHKRRLAKRLTNDITTLSGVEPDRVPGDDITVIIPTSVIPSHPSLVVIAATLDSIRERLPNSEIVITCDGVRDELAHRTDDYLLYLRRLLCATNRWPNVVPVVRRTHGHQGNTTRTALDFVDTPLVLFVEHDTPLIGDIPFPELSAAIASDVARVIRLHHEAQILDVHRHLMLDERPRDVCGAPMIRTRQWSQRPHLASAHFYRWMIGRYFGPESRTMIEDVMHGVVDHAVHCRGEAGWMEWRLWIYHPDGDMKRSGHIDGREGDPKFEEQFVFAYDTDDVPDGAPYPTAWRVD